MFVYTLNASVTSRTLYIQMLSSRILRVNAVQSVKHKRCVKERKKEGQNFEAI